MRTFNSFIAVPIPAAGDDYDLQQEVVDGQTLWGEICNRLFDVEADEGREFGKKVMRAIWLCAHEDEFYLGRHLGVRVHDDRDYTRPLPHIVLDIVRRVQTLDAGRMHHAMRSILGDDQMSDRFIGAIATSYIIFEEAA